MFVYLTAVFRLVKLRRCCYEARPAFVSLSRSTPFSVTMLSTSTFVSLFDGRLSLRDRSWF